MKINELQSYLESEGYNPLYYHIGDGWKACGDTICISKKSYEYQVFYVEKGNKTHEFFVSLDKQDSCDKFIETLDKEKNSKAFCICSYIKEDDAEKLEAIVKDAGMKYFRNDISYGGYSDMRYRIFVYGKDRFKAQEFANKIRPTSRWNLRLATRFTRNVMRRTDNLGG